MANALLLCVHGSMCDDPSALGLAAPPAPRSPRSEIGENRPRPSRRIGARRLGDACRFPRVARGVGMCRVSVLAVGSSGPPAAGALRRVRAPRPPLACRVLCVSVRHAVRACVGAWRGSGVFYITLSRYPRPQCCARWIRVKPYRYRLYFTVVRLSDIAYRIGCVYRTALTFIYVGP